MNRREFVLASVASLLVFPVSGQAQSTAVEKPRYAGEWRLQITQQSTAAGTLTLAIRPRSQPEVLIPVPIAKDRPSDGIARDIRSALRGKIDRSAYTIKLEGRDALVFIAEMGTPRFELAVVNNTVAGIEVAAIPQ